MENQDKLTSVVIITYKREISILKRAILSAVNQTHSNLEIIIVNDSPESTELAIQIQNLIKDFNDDRIKYIAHEKNAGACKARNTGILASHGEYIALLDDDDEWMPEKIEKQLTGFTSEDIGMVYSPFYNIITADGKKELAVRGTKSGDLTDDLLWKNCLGGSSMPMMRRVVFDECGLFDERLLSSQDYDMWLRISEKYKINYVGEYLTNRYLLEESITMNFTKQKQGFDLFTEKHIDKYLKNHKALNYRYNRQANKWFELGYFKEGFSTYKKAVKAKFLSKYNFTEPTKGIFKRIVKGKQVSK